jgi:hypothetical protein
MLTEKMMEDEICNDPDKYLGEKGLKLIKRQFSIGECRYDLLFEDRYGGKLIVELQKGTLNRDHFLRIMYYQLEYKVKYPDEFTDIWVIANRIPYDKRNKFDSLGIKWKEIAESEFSGILFPDIETDKRNNNFTSSSYQRKKSGSQMAKQWDEASFIYELEKRGGTEIAKTAKKIVEWGLKNELTIDWGKGESHGGFQIKYNRKSLISVKVSGKVTIWFYRLHHETITFKGDDKKIELLNMLNNIKGISISKKDITKEPSILIAVLLDESSLNRFLEILDWVTIELKKGEK